MSSGGGLKGVPSGKVVNRSDVAAGTKCDFKDALGSFTGMFRATDPRGVTGGDGGGVSSCFIAGPHEDEEAA